ncbi:MAG: MFS transporter [Steroidobacteraceae bacterium]
MSAPAYEMDGTAAIERSLFAKVTVRLLLPIALLTFVNAIDRMNISFAGAALSRDLGLSPSAFGAGVSLFFVAYLLFQYPHALLLRRWGLRNWLLLSVSLWGVASVSMAYASAPWHFYSVRFLLGMAEAGFAPGMTWLISQWAPARMRGRALSIALVAVPIALVLGGPLCGFLLGMSNPLEVAGWRWMFLVSAIPNFVLAIAAWFYFVDGPAEARWLSPDERALLDSQNVAQAPEVRGGLDARDGRLWRCALVWLCVMTGAYALVYWLPQLVRQLAPGEAELLIGTLSALPQAGIAAGLLLNAWHSDRSGERVRHVAAAALLGGLAMLIAAGVPSGGLTLGLLTLAGLGVGAAQGVFWTLPAALGIGGGRPSVEAIALISMFGTAGGIIGPWLLGVLVQGTGSFTMGIGVLAALLVVAAAIVFTFREVTQ